eukprot:TRINITY_DN9372_c0_g1_i7.p1 TRINITY_DN9372_c0_g1~~TRINITY_DN9372_c0_g1_i7.p1  ORF type:complete len:396 (-),score=16.03 TRINITY_DN9372_c0_g1_i7:62-1249(-)
MFITYKWCYVNRTCTTCKLTGYEYTDCPLAAFTFTDEILAIRHVNPDRVERFHPGPRKTSGNERFSQHSSPTLSAYNYTQKPSQEFSLSNTFYDPSLDWAETPTTSSKSILRRPSHSHPPLSTPPPQFSSPQGQFAPPYPPILHSDQHPQLTTTTAQTYQTTLLSAPAPPPPLSLRTPNPQILNYPSYHPPLFPTSLLLPLSHLLKHESTSPPLSPTRNSTHPIVPATSTHTAHQSRTPPPTPTPPGKTAEKRPRSSSLSSPPHILKSPRTWSDSSSKQSLITSSLTHKTNNLIIEDNLQKSNLSQENFQLSPEVKMSNCLLQLTSTEYSGLVKNFFPDLSPSRDPDCLNAVLNSLTVLASSEVSQLAITTFLQQTKTYNGKQLSNLFPLFVLTQ